MCGRDWAAWGQRGLIDDFFLATYTETIEQMPETVRRARKALGPDVVLRSALCPYYRYLKSNDEMIRAARAQLGAGSDGLWIYREDFVERLDLWSGAEAASQLARNARPAAHPRRPVP
jgi:hypothetical protein